LSINFRSPCGPRFVGAGGFEPSGPRRDRRTLPRCQLGNAATLHHIYGYGYGCPAYSYGYGTGYSYSAYTGYSYQAYGYEIAPPRKH